MGKHIIHSDMAFDAYQNDQELDPVEYWRNNRIS
jgi:hypothetical protein